jgi:hypothetical protein
MSNPLEPNFAAALRAKVNPIIAARRAATPHVVPQPGLLRSEIGDDAFFAKIEERRKWIAEKCSGHVVEDELLAASGNVIGRSYRFSDYHEAFYFRMRF